MIAMNGNTIIGGNKTPRIGDRIYESAGGLDGLEYVTRLQEDGERRDIGRGRRVGMEIAICTRGILQDAEPFD